MHLPPTVGALYHWTVAMDCLTQGRSLGPERWRGHGRTVVDSMPSSGVSLVETKSGHGVQWHLDGHPMGAKVWTYDGTGMTSGDAEGTAYPLWVRVP